MKIIWDKAKGVKDEPLKELTLKRYEDNLIKLYGVMTDEPKTSDKEIDLGFLKDVDKIKKTLSGEKWGLKGNKGISKNTIKNYLK